METRRQWLRLLAAGSAGGFAGCPLDTAGPTTEQGPASDATPTRTPTAMLSPNATTVSDGQVTVGPTDTLAVRQTETPSPSPREASPIETQDVALTAADGDAEDYFGSAVSLTEGTALVGAENRVHDDVESVGSAYIFSV